MKDSPFFKQADLLVQMLPFVNTETCFALKGGTAINFFVRNFPRLSVDIDLVYVPVEDRAASLRGIDGALKRIGAKIRRSMPAAHVTERKLAAENSVVKLTVRVPNLGEVKIEPNTVLAGWCIQRRSARWSRGPSRCSDDLPPCRLCRCRNFTAGNFALRWIASTLATCLTCMDCFKRRELPMKPT